jgi:hypothetical protein
MAKRLPHDQPCPVAGCKAKRPHTEDPVVRALLAYFDTPAVIARQALIGMTQLHDSMREDLEGNRSFAILTRIRQVEELFHRIMFFLFAATPEEIPHFLSEEYPDNFGDIFGLVNQRLFNGRLTLDKRIIQGNELPDQTLWKIMNETAHGSMRALQMAHDFRHSDLQKKLIDTVVQQHVLILSHVLCRLERGDSIEQIRRTLVAR